MPTRILLKWRSAMGAEPMRIVVGISPFRPRGIQKQSVSLIAISESREVLIERGIPYVAFEGFDIDDTVDNAPSNFIYAEPSPAHRHRSSVRCEMVQRSANSFWFKYVGFIVISIFAPQDSRKRTKV